MPPIVRGIQNSPIRLVEQSLQSDRFGVDLLTLVEEVPDSLFPQGLYAFGAIHPRFTSMALSKRSSERGHAGKFWKTSYVFEGYISSLPEPTYELSGALDQQPIATHPDFADIAGTPSAPLNGAVFIDPETGRPTTDDAKGVFREFGLGGGSLAGVESYLDPGATWTKTSFVLATPANLRALGTIQTPDGSPPGLTGRDWLFWETSFRRRGFIVELRETWKLSGRGGWNPTIY